MLMSTVNIWNHAKSSQYKLSTIEEGLHIAAVYSLEEAEEYRNQFQAALGNVSASNDPQQQVHDGNEQLIKGAEVLGAGRTLGLTDDEAIDTKISTLRREQREKRARRGKKISDPKVREEIKLNLKQNN